MTEYIWRLHVPIVVTADEEQDENTLPSEDREVAVLVSELTLPFPYHGEAPWIEVPSTDDVFTVTVQPVRGVWIHAAKRFDVYCDPESFTSPQQVSAYMAAAMKSGVWAVDDSGEEDPDVSGAHLSVAD